MERRLVRLREQIDTERKQRQARLAQAPVDGKLWTSSSLGRTSGTRHLAGRGNTTMLSPSRRERGRSQRSTSAARTNGTVARPACSPVQMMSPGGSESARLASPRSPQLLPPLPQQELARLSSPSSPDAALRAKLLHTPPTGSTPGLEQYPALQRRKSGLAELGSVRAEPCPLPAGDMQQISSRLTRPDHTGTEAKEPEQQQAPCSDILGEGCFDEAASQHSFQAAVAAWRSGGEAGAPATQHTSAVPLVQVASCSTGTTAVSSAAKSRLSLFQQISMRKRAADAGCAAAQASRCAQDPLAQREARLRDVQQQHASHPVSNNKALPCNEALLGPSVSASGEQPEPICHQDTAGAEPVDSVAEELEVLAHDNVQAAVDALQDGVTVLAIETADPCQAMTSRARLPDAIVLP